MVTATFTTVDKPGALEEALRIFWKLDLNLTRLESRPSPGTNFNYDFHVDFEGSYDDPITESLMDELSRVCLKSNVVNPKEVPWFPRSPLRGILQQKQPEFLRRA